MRKKIKDNPNMGLSFLYNTVVGRTLLKPFVATSFISKLAGRFMNTRISKIFINHFIKSNMIIMEEYKKENYKCFNDFFIRNIKEELRPIDKYKNSFISPCDSKLTVYKINDNLLFNVKNSIYSVKSVLNDEKLSKKYKDGYALVFRLTPDDYHHYCNVDDGTIIKHYKIEGKFHTVNPISYDNYQVFKENTREVTMIKTNNTGTIAYIEVGALLVGKINNLKVSGNIKKGKEKGYFMYGGSTVIILIEKDKVKLDSNIIKNSDDGYETCVKYGEKIGKII